MSKLMAGSLIVLTVTLVNLATAYFTTGPAVVHRVARCDASHNVMQCQEAAQVNMVEATFVTAFTGIEGADSRFNAAYVLIGASMLDVGIELILQSWIPFLGS